MIKLVSGQNMIKVLIMTVFSFVKGTPNKLFIVWLALRKSKKQKGKKVSHTLSQDVQIKLDLKKKHLPR